MPNVILAVFLVSSASAALSVHGWVDRELVFELDVSGLGRGSADEVFRGIQKAADDWNEALRLPLLSVVPGEAPVEIAGIFPWDERDGIHFSRQIGADVSFGRQFGYTAERRSRSGCLFEADLFFNPVHEWFAYDGAIRYDGEGERVAEIHRVALHEFGHVLGFGHPTTDETETIMRSRMGDLDRLTERDRRYARSLANVLIARNRPRIERASFSWDAASQRGRVRLRGVTNRFFARRAWIRVRSSGYRAIVRLPDRRRWVRTFTVPGSKAVLTLIYLAPQRSRHFRGEHVRGR